jgi:dTDP-4-amino-4,6-dideoxygalactose transaminase
MRSVRTHGLEDGEALREGVNARLDELQAAVLNLKLPRLGRDLSRRRALCERYDQQLPDGAQRIPPAEGIVHARHLYVVRVPERERVREALAERGVATGVHYPIPIHRMRAYKFLGYGAGSLPVTERLAREVLTLPLYPELAEDAVDRVCTALADALA